MTLAQTQITDKVRVSSAAVYYEEHFGNRWQLETWVFSDDPRQPSLQIIHGSSLVTDRNEPPSDYFCDKVRAAHELVARNLATKFAQLTSQPTPENGNA